uniref:bifunctional isocitrate dehydrogenase kinase/phosphatase n=1 Tax=Ningiella ruwaisensis TaxID=2364274 RepID=UPI00109F7AD6|nr:bifunctional isocitrate dehydrogenase kinase/phosphatase [Ningiella ruwaisensis]
MLPLAKDIAQAILSGFNRHYHTFLYFTQGANARFESADWKSVQEHSALRIQSYDAKVNEAVTLLKNRFGIKTLDEHIWHWVKAAYIELLSDHKQPELAESFFNSLFCRMFDRRYYLNENIFVKTQVDPDTFSAYTESDRYQINQQNIHDVYKTIIDKLPLTLPVRQDQTLYRLMDEALSEQIQEDIDTLQHAELEILQPLFYRNKAAYVVGKISVGPSKTFPFVLPVLNNEKGELYIDSLIANKQDTAIIFGFARAYFMVDTQYPGAIVHFLKSILPSKTASELYTCIGLQKHGKTLFYRDFLEHLSQTDDDFVVAPGIRGMVMTVFTLPSYPFVFKLIKDKFAPQKEMTHATVKEKYQLVKQHDRVGRMADTLEFSWVAFPLNRFSDELLNELKKTVQSQLRIEGDMLLLKHVYIERRMTPLNLYLDDAKTEEQYIHAIREYGLAIKQIAAANIFPGDMLFKNFGVTRHGRVIFYDYDEICYLSECNFRHIPPPRYPEDEMASEPWYSVAPNDIFPEEFASFLLCDPNTRKHFKALHPDLLEATFWQSKQANIRSGLFEDVFPYNEQKRFKNRASL